VKLRSRGLNGLGIKRNPQLPGRDVARQCRGKTMKEKRYFGGGNTSSKDKSQRDFRLTGGGWLLTLN